MNIKTALFWAEKELKNTAEPKSSALVLMSNVLGIDRSKLFAYPEKKLTPFQQKKFNAYIGRRKNHEPVWQIIGKVNFWGLEYFVTKDVLVPRPETELLVEEVVNKVLARDYRVEDILDLGTGAGTIAVALGCEFPEICITAVDISDKALKVARKNAKHNQVRNIKFLKSDLFQNISGRYDIVCANLPYIPTEDMASLDFDVHHYEPKIALDGGRGGLGVYKNFFKDVRSHLNDRGIIFCEIGFKQGKEVARIVKKYLPGAKCLVSKDLAEIDRIAIIEV